MNDSYASNFHVIHQSVSLSSIIGFYRVNEGYLQRTGTKGTFKI